MGYNAEDQGRTLLVELADTLQMFGEFDRVVCVLIEWGLIVAETGAQAKKVWEEAKK